MADKVYANIRMVGIASTLHFLVDGLCVCCLYLMLCQSQLPFALVVVITYNVLAFLTQPFTGILADRMKQQHLMLFASLALLSVAVMLMAVIVSISRFSTSPVAMHTVAALLGLGNSLFHVWGGKQVAVKTRNDIRPLGVFVSTGAVGLAVGFVCYSWVLLCALLLVMCLLAILYVRQDNDECSMVNVQCSKINVQCSKNNGQWSKMRLSESRDELVQSLPSVSILGEANVQWLSLALIVLMAAVMMRSMVGERFTSDMVNGNTMVLVAGLIAMSGKMAGGWMAKSMGIFKALALMIGATLVCWFCRDMGITFLFAGLFAINLTMPVTLYLANVVLKDREGLAFGLLAAALIPGYLITQL